MTRPQRCHCQVPPRGPPPWRWPPPGTRPVRPQLTCTLTGRSWEGPTAAAAADPPGSLCTRRYGQVWVGLVLSTLIVMFTPMCVCAPHAWVALYTQERAGVGVCSCGNAHTRDNVHTYACVALARIMLRALTIGGYAVSYPLVGCSYFVAHTWCIAGLAVLRGWHRHDGRRLDRGRRGHGAGRYALRCPHESRCTNDCRLWAVTYHEMSTSHDAQMTVDYGQLLTLRYP